MLLFLRCLTLYTKDNQSTNLISLTTTSLSSRTQNLWTRPSRAPSRPSSHLSRPQRPSSSASCFALLRNVITVMRYSACWISSFPPNTCWRASNRLHVWVLIHFSACCTSALTHFSPQWRYTCIVVQFRDFYFESRDMYIFYWVRTGTKCSVLLQSCRIRYTWAAYLCT